MLIEVCTREASTSHMQTEKDTQIISMIKNSDKGYGKIAKDIKTIRAIQTTAISCAPTQCPTTQ